MNTHYLEKMLLCQILENIKNQWRIFANLEFYEVVSILKLRRFTNCRFGCSHHSIQSKLRNSKNDVNVKFTASCYLAGPGLVPVHTAHQFFSESCLMSNVINFSSLNSLNICSLKWIIFSSSGYICFIVSILNENLVNVTYGKLN